MSDFDPKDIVSDVSNSKSGDFDPADIHSADSKSEEPSYFDKGSKTDSFRKGVEQDITFSSADEIQGGIGAGMDATQALLNKLGIMDPSPSQVNAKLAEQGFSGDIGPKSIGEAYDSTRDQARQEYKDAAAANPISSALGNIAGAVLTGKVAGAALTPFTVAKDAGLAGKVATGALNAVPTAGLLGIGMSEGKTLKDVANDTITDSEIGAGIGGAIPLVGAGAKGLTKAAGNYIGEHMPSVARAYEKGRQGINTASESFVDSTNEKLSKLTNTLKEYTLGARNQVNKETHEAIEGLNTHINGIQDDIKKEIEATKQSQAAINEGQKAKLELQKADLANNIQAKVQDAKTAIGSTYDAIENQIADKGLTFNINHEISKLGEDLINNGMQPDDAERYVKSLYGAYEKTNLSLPELKQIKSVVSQRLNSANPAIRGAFKQFYGRIAQNQIGTLENVGLNDVAQNLKNTNQKFMSVLDLEDNFVGKLQADRVTKEMMANKEAIATLNNSLKPDAKNMTDTQEFMKKLGIIDPNLQQQVAPQLETLANQNRSIQNFQPNVSAQSDDMLANQAKLQELQAKLQKLKAGPEVKTQMDALMNSDEKGINDYIGNNIKNVNNPIMEPSRQNIENVLQSYQKATGKNLIPEAQDLIKDTELIKNGQKGLAATISPRGLKFGEATAQAPANLAGRIVKGATDLADNPLTTGIKKMVSMSNADMMPMIQKMTGLGPEGKEFANVLSQAMGKNEMSKTAIMFGLMQNPKFREVFHKANGTEDGQ